MKTFISEWTKLTTTNAIYWTTALFIFMAVGFAALAGSQVEPDPLVFNIPILYADKVVTAIAALGTFVVSVQAIMVVTAEYRHNYQSVTFMATPNRIVVALAKWLLYSIIVAIVTFITVILCFYMAKTTATEAASATLEVWRDDNARRIMWTYPLTLVLLVTFSQGVAWLLRQTAGAVALMSLWILALEGILSLLPHIGEYVKQYGPMSNMTAFLLKEPIVDGPWGVYGSGIYFACWAIVVFLIGVGVLKSRDA
ncbi:ABC-2 family transporter protein [Corynebacterium mustelae]|uniref:ABC-2 family transporter protein n=1 Tax=Corynebacterium mustelae TaxID=571915 RepID=A0A0G3H0R1_9CORY|nr:multidrug ABC transporter permease [Corynebacterium mustelae]AKK07001.1 ABC-2 family transporter protein [Corynebacterium mustelae]